MMTAEQVLASQKAQFDTLFDLSSKAFEGLEKLVELNLQLAKASMSEAAETTKAVLSVKDVQELVALQSSLVQPSAEKAVAYGRHLYEIAATTNAEVVKVAESQVADAHKKFMTVVDGAVKNAPAGSENAVALMKSAMAAASNAYDNLNKAAKQAADTAEANFQAMTSSAVKASQSASAKARRAANAG